MLALCLLLSFPLMAQTTVRIKDIAYIQGVRENQLMGFGIVTGLEGDGDSRNSSLLAYTLSNLVSSFGVEISPQQVRSRNCAAVMVTADIPPFVRPGDRITVRVSSIGDADSLAGGVLLQTNLKAANNNVYAVAQGTVSAASGDDSVKTVATVPDGAIIERSVLSEFITDGVVSIVLYNPDFTTAYSVATAIAEELPDNQVKALDGSLIQVTLTEEQAEDPVGIISRIESLQINPDISAKVVINPRSGVIVMGKDVRIGKVAVSYKGDKISVGVGSPFGRQEEPKEHFLIEENTTVENFVTVLQEVGMKTEVIVDILKAIQKSGSLYGKLITM